MYKQSARKNIGQEYTPNYNGNQLLIEDGQTKQYVGGREDDKLNDL